MKQNKFTLVSMLNQKNYNLYVYLLAPCFLIWANMIIFNHIPHFFLLHFLYLLFCLPIGYIISKAFKLYNRKQKIRKKLLFFLKSNNFFQTETIEIKDSNNRIKKEKIIINSVVIGFIETDTELIIRAYKDGDCFTDKMNDLDTSLSALFNLPLENKFDRISFCDYTFNKSKDERIIVQNKSTFYNKTTLLPLTHNLCWNILKQPHLLLAGVTGSGKTTFLNYLIIEFKKMQAEIYICDPKRSDLASLKHILGANYVATDINNIAKLSRIVKEIMENRFIEYKENAKNFVYGYSFVDYKLTPIFFIFDELGAFRANADKKVFSETLANLTEIILKGREMGVFCVLSTQQPNANNIPTELRDNLSVRMALGNMSSEAYRMVFGEDIKDLQTINGLGKGYIYLDGLGWSKPRPFESPYLDYKNYDFIEELKKYQKITLNDNL